MLDNMKIGFIPLGCAKNDIDAGTMITRLKAAGHTITFEVEDDIDCFVINTCAFTQEAQQEAIDTILETAQYQHNDKKPKIIVTGCLPERFGDQLKDLMTEITDIAKLVDINRIEEIVEPGTQVLSTINEPAYRLTPNHWAYLRISDGCSNHCSFCTIPSIRGELTSVAMEELIENAEILVAEGVRELNLIAQDTASYGVDIYQQKRLPELIKRIAAIENLAWLRVLYIHPDHLDYPLLETLANTEKVVPYLDLPFQHAAAELLQSMGRSGTGESYLELIRRIRKMMPGVAIRSSIIVGYPGETEEHLAELEKFLRAAKLDRVAFFRYSSEEDTPAAVRENHIEEKIQIDRINYLEDLQSEIYLEIEDELEDKILTAMVEEIDEENHEILLRSTREAPEVDGFLHMELPKKHNLVPGQIVQFKITEPCPFDSQGVIV
jgi:ribosomal protein S12 methylthiotransferase